MVLQCHLWACLGLTLDEEHCSHLSIPAPHIHSFPCPAKSWGHTLSRVCAPPPGALLCGGPFPRSSRSLDTRRREKTRDLGARHLEHLHLCLPETQWPFPEGHPGTGQVGFAPCKPSLDPSWYLSVSLPPCHTAELQTLWLVLSAASVPWVPSKEPCPALSLALLSMDIEPLQGLKCVC